MAVSIFEHPIRDMETVIGWMPFTEETDFKRAIQRYKAFAVKVCFAIFLTSFIPQETLSPSTDFAMYTLISFFSQFKTDFSLALSKHIVIISNVRTTSRN